MIQSYVNLKNQLLNLNQSTLLQGQIQKIYSSAQFVCLSVRSRGKSTVLYLGRGQGVEGLWWSHELPPSTHRCRDQFLEYLRKYLTNTGFGGFELDAKDRILTLEYHKYAAVNKLSLFWKGRQLYFSHYYFDHEKESYILFKSWVNKSELVPSLENINQVFDEVGRSELQKNDPITEVKDVKLILKDELVETITEQTRKAKFLTRKKARIFSDLEEARKGHDLRQQMNQIDFVNLAGEVNLSGIEFIFQVESTEFEKRNIVFEKIKKLKKGQQILEARLESTELDLKILDETSRSQTVKRSPTKPVWTHLQTKKIEVEKKTSQDYRVISWDSIQIGVGLSAQGNDHLRNSWGNKDDYWIHLDGYESAHAIIKKQHQLPPSQDEIELAATILAIQSGFSAQKIPILFTQVKNLKGVSGKPGMVIYKKEKRLVCLRIDLSLRGVVFP